MRARGREAGVGRGIGGLSLGAALSCLVLAIAVPAATTSGMIVRQASAAMDDGIGASDRFWGRYAFVPDWRAARALDAAATRRFLSDYWPALHPRYAEGGGNGKPSSRTPEPAVFLAALSEAIVPGYQPSASQQAARPATLYAAQGESEALSLGVRSGAAPVTVTVRVSELSAGAQVISREDITQRLVLSYPARRRPKSPPDDLRPKPMVMLAPPAGEWRFPPHTSHNYFIDVHVPSDAEPGRYHGTIEVLADGRPLRSLPLAVEVLPFRLRVNDFHAGAFGTTYDLWEGGFTGYYPKMMEMDSRYGFNLAAGFFNKGNEIPFTRSATDELIVDTADEHFAAFNDTMRRLRSYGMGDVAFWNWGASGNVQQFNNVLAAAGFPGIDTNAGKRGFAKICRAIKNAEHAFGWPELVINPFDEALDNQDATREVIRAIPHVRALSPATRLYMTEWREHFARLYQSSGEVLAGSSKPGWVEYAKLLASLEAARMNFAVIGSNRGFADSRALQDELGGEYWHYGAATEMNAWVRFLYGFLPYRVRAEAALSWANYKGELDGSGWTLHYVMPRRGDGRRAGDTRGPVLASPRALLVREGIDDRKYIETLRYHAVESASREDLAYLRRLAERVAAMADTRDVGGRSNREAKTVDAALIRGERAALRERILTLVAARGVTDTANGNVQ